MKKQQKPQKQKISRIIATGIVAMLAFAPTYSAIAWGPERETFSWDTAAPYRTMNSITDNPSLGDERNFVRVRKVGDPTFLDEVEVEYGQEYEVEIYYHNNASIDLNPSGAGIADGVRISAILPEFVGAGETGEISATITAANTTPTSVWDEAYIISKGDSYIRFVSGSAVIHSNGSVDGYDVGQQHLFSEEGANVGYWDDAWGVLPGCNQYAGYISFRFTVDQPRFEMKKEVSRLDQDEWVENITANPGEELEFKVTYKNTGSTQQSDVNVRDELSSQLMEYLLGTTFLVNGSSPEGIYVADDLFANGLNIGRYQPGSEAVLTYKIKMPSEEQLACGENVFSNAASVITGNGTMTDKVNITISKECTPTELPETGPGEIALMIVAILAIGVGGTYWYRSQKHLRSITKAAKVDGDGNVTSEASDAESENTLDKE